VDINALLFSMNSIALAYLQADFSETVL